jgi:hypothetical protein
MQLSTIHHSSILRKVCILSSPRNALAGPQQTIRDDSSNLTRLFHVAALRKAAELQGIKSKSNRLTEACCPHESTSHEHHAGDE